MRFTVSWYGDLARLGITQSARANFIATMNQVGTNVVATGSGTIDLTGLTFFSVSLRDCRDCPQ